MSTILALDVGERRIGLALASVEAGLAHPFKTLTNDDQIINELKQIIESEGVTSLVVGVPRGLDGQATNQTKSTENFIEKLRGSLDVKVSQIDEAVTSRQAEQELKSRSKPYAKEDIDALAATYILEDYLKENY